MSSQPKLSLPAAAQPLFDRFSVAFSQPTFQRFVLLAIGSILAMGRRTTTAADLPDRSPTAATLPAPIFTRRRRPQTHCSTIGVTLPAGR